MVKSITTKNCVAAGEARARVLVVDDIAENRLLLGLYCESFGLEHEFAENGLQAVEAVRSGRFDLVLMDILMPRMDGMAATRAIRALGGPVAEIPIIAVTTAAAPGEVLRYLACGMTDVAAKPVARGRLAEVISAVLAAPRYGNLPDQIRGRAASAA